MNARMKEAAVENIVQRVERFIMLWLEQRTDALRATCAADPAFCDLVVDLLGALNARIRFLFDVDHEIGHAYLLRVSSYEELRQVFVDRLIPLLEDYFHGAWEKICIVLGCPYDGFPCGRTEERTSSTCA